MSADTELAFLVTRERQSRELAVQSGDVSVRLAHVKMADTYAEQIRVAKLAMPL